MNIVGEKVILRALEYEDMEVLREMLNDPEIESKVIGWSFPVSSFEQKSWYEKTINDKLNHRFAIQIKDGETVGVATLVNIDWKNRKATHGIKLSSKTPKGKGIGTDVVMSIMKYAFEELQLNRLDGSWFEDNIASKTLYTKCGWVAEGRIRRSIFKNNEYKDEIIAGILKEEYFETLNNLRK